MQVHVEHARSTATSAHDGLVAAQAALDTAAGGEVVDQVDAMAVWRAASDLDLGALNTLRAEVAALQDNLSPSLTPIRANSDVIFYRRTAN